ncbi:MAG: ATP-binding cassette domain-containing protein [Actinomycetaceae bacterium]|nr:ATP-binding cassette domain-containing protein [Arcanobacterium sp.]MDD7505866.1 ATP-binding cassette domain-containing protein [Actinomycetaceae bacterium]MDY6142915.1 ATP-binding cassette domain-containing protein [Arcanobacterium sp.]
MDTIVSLEGINKRYGDHEVLRDFSLSVTTGEMIALIGSSGAGKTTLLNIIGALDLDYSGAYYFNGKPVARSSRKARLFRAKELAYLFQNFALLEDRTVEHNLRILTRDRDLMSQALHRVGLDGFLAKKIYTMSGGEQQRVALARAVIKQSSLLLADEPTGSLDEDNGRRMMEILTGLKEQGKTIIVVTHNQGILEYFDRVVTIG